MKTSIQVAVALGLAVVTVSPGTVRAQPAPLQAEPVRASRVQEVYPRDLMSFSERFEMWRRMRAARTQEERFDLWEQKRIELEQRATEKGVRLREMGPIAMSHGPHENEMKWSGEHHIDLRNPSSIGMHPRPPMGR